MASNNGVLACGMRAQLARLVMCGIRQAFECVCECGMWRPGQGMGPEGQGPLRPMLWPADFSFLAFLGRFREQPRARARRCAVLFTCVSIFETIYTLLKLKKGQKAIRDTQCTRVELVEHGCSGSGSNPGREPGGRGRRVRERERARAHAPRSFSYLGPPLGPYYTTHLGRRRRNLK